MKSLNNYLVHLSFGLALCGSGWAQPSGEYEAIRENYHSVSVVIGAAFVPPSFRVRGDMLIPGYANMKALITRFEIKTGGKPVIVPLDAFAGLSDPVSVDVVESRLGKRWILVLKGGDASTAYCAKLAFDVVKVLEVRLFGNCTETIPFAVKKYPNSIKRR